jgi:uncharacterized membrane protein
VNEDDETQRGRPEVAESQSADDNTLGRLLTLSDGIFAIAMTLLALSLAVPDVGAHPSDATLRHALAANSDSYWSFLLTFYVIAGYWGRHRRLMRSVVGTHPALIRDTLWLLFLVAAMPFPASLLGRYGSEPISLALYGAFNALATLTLIVMSSDVRRLQLSDGEFSADDDYAHHWTTWLSLFVFLLCIPAGYVLGHRGPYVLLLLAIPAVIPARRARRLGSWISTRRRIK